MKPDAETRRAIRKECWQIIGVVDAYGALHHKKVYDGEDSPYHQTLWPTISHKRWRFYVSDWRLDDSVLGDNSLEPDDIDRILSLADKILPVPAWIRRGRAWEEAGRPHGKAGDAFDRKWNKAEAKRLAAQAAGPLDSAQQS